MQHTKGDSDGSNDTWAIESLRPIQEITLTNVGGVPGSTEKRFLVRDLPAADQTELPEVMRHVDDWDGEFLQAEDGSIWAKCSDGEQSCFWIAIRLAPAEHCKRLQVRECCNWWKRIDTHKWIGTRHDLRDARRRHRYWENAKSVCCAWLTRGGEITV